MSLVGPLITILSRYVRLSRDDLQAFDDLISAPLVKVEARRDIICEGDDPKVVRLMVSGWAARYKDLPDGRRQIVGLFIPGDFCDLNVYILQAMDHSIGALTSVSYLAISPDKLRFLIENRPRIAQALLWHELVTSSTQREWLLNIGQRSAYERIAHFFVEMFIRMKSVGLADDNTCAFPMTQNDLAEVAGISPVHVNRNIQELRRDGLIELERKRLTIVDMKKLMDVSMFNANYLHMNHEGGYLDAND